MFSLFNETALQICEGQQFDMNFEEREIVSEQEYIQMITHKTAVLLAASLKMGALSADADSVDSGNLYEFGKYLGLSFQLQDDYLDLYGDPEVFGKNIGGDIVSGKKTYLIIKAFELASEEDREKILQLLGSNKFSREEKIKQAKELFEKYRISQHTSDRIQGYLVKAKEAFQKVQVEDNRKQPLLELAEMLMNRSK
jgi:geranylgeranyl diphosphate synthase type II